jgi:hypothetical protein
MHIRQRALERGWYRGRCVCREYGFVIPFRSSGHHSIVITPRYLAFLLPIQSVGVSLMQERSCKRYLNPLHSLRSQHSKCMNVACLTSHPSGPRRVAAGPLTSVVRDVLRRVKSIKCDADGPPALSFEFRSLRHPGFCLPRSFHSAVLGSAHQF